MIPRSTQKQTSGTLRAELERLHEYNLVESSLRVGQALTKALKKEKEIMIMVGYIGSLSVAWRALTKIAAETQEAAYDRVKRELESLEIGVSEPVAEYFTRVHVILIKLVRRLVNTPDREIKRRTLGGLTPRYHDEVRLNAMRCEFDVKDLREEIARAESFQSDQERRNASAHVLAVAHAGGG